MGWKRTVTAFPTALNYGADSGYDAVGNPSYVDTIDGYYAWCKAYFNAAWIQCFYNLEAYIPWGSAITKVVLDFHKVQQSTYKAYPPYSHTIVNTSGGAVWSEYDYGAGGGIWEDYGVETYDITGYASWTRDLLSYPFHVRLQARDSNDGTDDPGGVYGMYAYWDYVRLNIDYDPPNQMRMVV